MCCYRVGIISICSYGQGSNKSHHGGMDTLPIEQDVQGLKSEIHLGLDPLCEFLLTYITL